MIWLFYFWWSYWMQDHLCRIRQSPSHDSRRWSKQHAVGDDFVVVLLEKRSRYSEEITSKCESVVPPKPEKTESGALNALLQLRHTFRLTNAHVLVIISSCTRCASSKVSEWMRSPFDSWPKRKEHAPTSLMTVRACLFAQEEKCSETDWKHLLKKKNE